MNTGAAWEATGWPPLTVPSHPLSVHSCLTTDTHWYRGAHCEHGILKNLVYGLVGAAAVLLLVLVCTFLGLMLRWQKEARR